MSASRLAVVGTCCIFMGVLVYYPLSAQNGDKSFSANNSLGDVRQFGAAGDGKADDTAAIQRAVDAPGGHIRFNAGTYRITRPIVVDLNQAKSAWITASGPARLIMAGPGPAIKFTGAAETNKSADTLLAASSPAVVPVVEGLEIVGDHPEAEGILAADTTQLRIKECNVHNVQHAIHLTARNQNVTISDCHLWRNRGVGLFMDKTQIKGLNVTDCHINSNAGGGIVSRGGKVRNVQISTCSITTNVGEDGADSANVLFDSTGGSTANVTVIGCTIQNDHRIRNSANIRVMGKGVAKIGDRTTENLFGHVTITGNLISDGDVNIDIQHARGIIITGNTLWLGYQHNMRLEDSADVVLGINLLDRNPAFEQESVAANSVLLRRCRDCTINGLHLHDTRNATAALMIDACHRFNVTTCTILDCDSTGIAMQGVHDSTLSDSVVRDDRNPNKRSMTIRSKGGAGNMIVDNMMVGPDQIELSTNHSSGNFGGYRAY